MDTTFYDSILPAGGLRVLATFMNGLGQAPTHTYYTTNEDLTEAAVAYDSLGKNVYHACASFKEASSRKGENAAAVKSLWVDLDVGPTKDYASAKAAAAAIESFRTALDLPQSWLVQSGGGVHVYFPFEKPVEPEKWKKLAGMFAACLDHAGVKHDPSRTTDVASVLRIPTTKNYKYDPPKNVKVVRAGAEAPVRVLYEKIKAYIDANNIIVEDGRRAKPGVSNELIGPKDFPPTHGDIIAKHCAIVRQAEETGGDNEFAIWWRLIGGVAKFCVDPEATAERWTKNRSATGHEQDDWKKQMDSWSTDPVTCGELSKHSGACAKCPHWGKIRTPLSLGHPEQPVSMPVPVAGVAPPAPKRTSPGPWEFGAAWIKAEIQAKTRTGLDSLGRMTMSMLQPDGTYKHRPFCDKYWQVMRRLRNTDGVWQLEIAYQTYPGHPHETFLIDSEIVTAPDMLKKAFSAREIHFYGGPKAMEVAQHVLRENQELLADYQEEHRVAETMGWATDGGSYGRMTGEFVLGHTLIRPKKAPTDVMLDDSIPANLRDVYQTEGTTGEWVNLIDYIYNRPGAEPYQFVIAAMFAAPLVRLAPGATTWHGIPIALCGDSGSAKTSTAKVAMTVYGKPDALLFTAQKGQGDTINALSAKMGSLKNLPFVADELTGQDPEHVRDILYMLANGKAKDRMAQNGRLIPNPYWWSTIPLITSNESMHDKVRQLQSAHVQDATALRCFEITLLKDDMKRVFPDINKGIIDGDLTAKQYGCVGREWLQFVVNNQTRISNYLGEARRTYKVSDNDQSDVRFYADLLMTVEAAATLAHKRGFIKWNVSAMMKWAKAQVQSLVAAVRERNWDEHFSAYVASLHGRTIVTNKCQIGPGRRHAVNMEMSREPLSTSKLNPPVARRATDDKLFFVTVASVKRWCVDERVDFTRFIQACMSSGYILASPEPNGTYNMSISASTTYSVPRCPCYRLDYEKAAPLVTSKEAEEETPDNVIALPVKGNELTVSVEGSTNVESAT